MKYLYYNWNEINQACYLAWIDRRVRVWKDWMRTERRRSTRISRENRVKDHSATKRATDRRLFCTSRQTHCFLVLLWSSDIVRISGQLAIDEAPWRNILVRCTRDFRLRSWSERSVCRLVKKKKNGLEKMRGVADGHTNVSRSPSTVELVSGSFV